jgi:2-polyprenyl-3-methyl-5-hydroxy-6-metoxy-1,4-benzoquinol methylase
VSTESEPAADLTQVDHWDATWAGEIGLRLPSPWISAIRDLQRLLRRYVKPGDRVLEVGCAPGKVLAWVAADLKADVSGLDYSARGLAQAARLFSALGIPADLRQEDLRKTTLPRGGFDVVYSVGVIEHFEDPREIVRDHLALVRAGGVALMTVPRYRGLYGSLQRYFNPESLLYHNLEIMTPAALAALAPPDGSVRVRTYTFGRLSPWVLSTEKRWPPPVVFAVSHLLNLAALVQPFDVAALSPMVVLEITKLRDSEVGGSPRSR